MDASIFEMDSVIAYVAEAWKVNTLWRDQTKHYSDIPCCVLYGVKLKLHTKFKSSVHSQQQSATVLQEQLILSGSEI
jgi:hypothetical protein